MKAIDISSIEKHYRIDRNGLVWSYRLGRYLRPSDSHGHAMVFLPEHGRVLLSTLVSKKYLGDRPDGYVVGYIDDNSMNCAVENLFYLSFGDSVKNGRRRGKLRTWVLPDHAMIEGHRKGVIASDGREWNSREECAAELGLTRVGLYKAIKRGGCRGLKLRTRPL